MKQLIDGVYRLEGLRSSNAFLIDSSGDLALVDTGMAGDAARIIKQIEAVGYKITELKTVMLTHAHGDHTGGAAGIVQRSGAMVMSHRSEVPYIEGKEKLPSGSVLQRAVRWLDNRISGGGPGIMVSRALEDGDRLDYLGGLEVIHSPGHTPGSICLYQERNRVLFSGDLLFNGNLITGRGGLRYPPRFFSVDSAEVEKSFQRLGSLMVRVLCVGHGDPIVRREAVRLSDLFQVY